jgi:hypothetical protein
MSIFTTGTTGSMSAVLLHSLAAIEHPPVRALARDPAKAPPTRAGCRTSRPWRTRHARMHMTSRSGSALPDVP